MALCGSSQTPRKMYKLWLLGDPAVGKTSLMIRRTDQQFFLTSACPDHLGIRIAHVLYEDKQVRLQINDSASKQQYSAIGVMNKDTDVVVLVCDATRRDTFTSLGQWLEGIENKFGTANGRVLMVLNKTDCTDEERKVSSEEARRFAADMGIPLVQASAKTNTNVDLVFHEAIATVFANEKDDRRRDQFEQSVQLTRDPTGRCHYGCTLCARHTCSC